MTDIKTAKPSETTIPEAAPVAAPVEPKAASQLKVTQIGNSLGVILPKELVAKLKVGKGDVLFATDQPGGVMLSAYDEKVERQIRLGREFMAEYKETLRELAK